MNKIGKNALILWICAGVCVVGGLGCFATSVGAGIFGLVLAGVLGFIGYKQYIKFKEATEAQEAAERQAERERAEREQQKAQAAQEMAEIKRKNAAKFETVLVKVAGVTFDNENGKSRQAILKRLKSKEKRFEHPDEIELKKTTYKGKDAIAIFVDGDQVGNVPADQVPYLIENWDRIYDTPNIDVYGGGFNEITEEKKNYGAELTIRLNKV